MPHTEIRYSDIPNGEGLRCALSLLEHLKGDPSQIDHACAIKDAWVVQTAIYSKVWPGEPDEDLVIGEDPFDSYTGDMRVICEQIIIADAEQRGVEMSAVGLDWASLLKLLLPIIIKLIEDLLGTR